jgi:hypothetical protein
MYTVHSRYSGNYAKGVERTMGNEEQRRTMAKESGRTMTNTRRGNDEEIRARYNNGRKRMPVLLEYLFCLISYLIYVFSKS